MTTNTRGSGWDLSSNEEYFPAGGWDDMDAAIESARYEIGEYGCQMFVMLKPEPYEFEARGEEEPLEGQEFEGQPRFWWSLGGGLDKYKIDEEGMRITEGGRPNKNTAFVKGTVMLLQALGRQNMSNDLTWLNEGEPVVVHWKRVPEDYRYRDNLTGERKTGTREVMLPVGKRLGYSKLAEEEEGGAAPARARGRRAARGSGGGSAAESSGSSSGGSRRSRRGAGSASGGDPVGRAASNRRSRRAAQQEELSPPPGDETDADPPWGDGDTPEDGSDAPEDPSYDILRKIVNPTGDEGVARRTIGRLAREYVDEYGADAIKKAVSKATLDAAIEDGVLEEDGSRLFTPVED